MSGIEQSIVVAHQKVAFNLLQRVQYNTYENEQRGSSEELCKFLFHSEHTGSAKAGMIAINAMKNEPGNVSRDITVSR